MVPVLGGEIVEGEQRLAILEQAGDGPLVLRDVLGFEGGDRRLGGLPVGASQISRRSWRACCSDFGSLFRIFTALWIQHR